MSRGNPSASFSAARATSRSAAPPDPLLLDGGQVDADREHVDIGGHPGGADRLGALQVGFGGAQRLLGRTSDVPPRSTAS